jgi:hypothetical protein
MGGDPLTPGKSVFRSRGDPSPGIGGFSDKTHPRRVKTMEDRIWPGEEVEEFEGSFIFSKPKRGEELATGPCQCAGEMAVVTEESDEAERGDQIPGMPETYVTGYAIVGLSGEDQPLVLRRDYGSVLASYNKAKLCYPGRVLSTYWYAGKARLHATPCIICSQNGEPC